jgi:hypothetical protein
MRMPDAAELPAREPSRRQRHFDSDLYTGLGKLLDLQQCHRISPCDCVSGDSDPARLSNPNPNPNPELFAAPGDFNGDCRSDILWRNSSTEQVYIWLMNGTTLTSSGSPGSPDITWQIAPLAP